MSKGDKVKTTILAAAVPVLLVACASSGPVPIGQDTYLISKQSAGGVFVAPSTVKVEILQEANAYCKSQGKEFQIVSTNELSAIPMARMPSAEVQFMCLERGDPQLARPRLRKGPDTVVEIRK
jgi:hypothetical protein